MDKTTNKQHILKRALTLMVGNLCSGRLYILNEPTDEPVSPVPNLQRPGVYLKHNHHYAEIVQALDKPAWLEMENRRIKLAADNTYLIMPQTIHAERYYNRRSPYDLLWTVLGPASVSMFLSRYLPAETAGDAERYTQQSQRCESLWKLTSLKHLEDKPLQQAKLQSELIQLAIEVIEKKQASQSPSYSQQIVDQIKGYIDHHYEQPITVEELAQMVRFSPNHLNTVFRRTVGKPLHRYITDKRLAAARELLEDEQLLVKQIAFKVGFSDPLYFSRLFRRRFGKTPSQFTENNNN